MEDTNEIVITTDDVKNTPKDWVTSHLENKGKPVWQRVLDIDRHKIQLTSYDSEFEFSQLHEEELIDLVRRARTLNPRLIENFRRLIFDDYQPQSRYHDEERFPFNGTRLEDGVLLYKRGQRTDIRHRTGVASNFQGTVAHECFHFIDSGFEEAWKQAFDWHFVAENISDWEKVSGLSERTFRNRQSGWIAYEGQYTNHPEWCVTDYAKLAWDDDFADSGVTTLFNFEKMKNVSSPKADFILNTNMSKVQSV